MTTASASPINDTTQGISWEHLRRQMPVARRWAYFDHAAVAPLTGVAQQALAHFNEDAALNGAAFYPAWMKQKQELRRRAAGMIGADIDEIAFVGSTTAGINLVAEGFPWQPGDNVVTRADEFPSNQYPWLRLADVDVETRRIPTEGGKLDLDRLLAACDQRTKIVTISWVTYSYGWRHDLDRLAEAVHQRGTLLFVDAIQGLGVFPLDVKNTPIDFLAADGHKWMLGPEGAGLFFLRREHLNLLRPLGVGWNSVKAAHDFNRIEYDLKDTAERYEGGAQNVAGLIALGASLELLMQFPAHARAARVLQITDLACQRLREQGAIILSDRTRDENKSGIVLFELPGRDPQAIRRACMEKGVILSCRSGHLRISPHAYNDESDVDRLIKAIG
ncbi:MAG: aminotransferase class V-fold PLP-dependent enzyme [Thermoguttaceae bacterium]